MKFTGELKLRKILPDGLEYRAEVEGLPLPINVSVPGAKGLQKEGTIVIEIPEVEMPKSKGKK